MALRKIVLSLSIVVAAIATAQEVRFDELSGSVSARTADVAATGAQVLTAGDTYDDVPVVAAANADSSLERIGLTVGGASAAAGSKSNMLCRLTAF